MPRTHELVCSKESLISRNRKAACQSGETHYWETHGLASEKEKDKKIKKEEEKEDLGRDTSASPSTSDRPPTDVRIPSTSRPPSIAPPPPSDPFAPSAAGRRSRKRPHTLSSVTISSRGTPRVSAAARAAANAPRSVAGTIRAAAGRLPSSKASSASESSFWAGKRETRGKKRGRSPFGRERGSLRGRERVAGQREREGSVWAGERERVARKRVHYVYRQGYMLGELTN